MANKRNKDDEQEAPANGVEDKAMPGEAIDDVFGAEVLVEDQQFGSIYPVIQYVNGDLSKKKSGGLDHTGGFFISADQGIEAPPSFEPHVLVTREGTEIQGFAKRDIQISPIRHRRCWQAQPQGDQKGLSMRFGWSEYDDASAYGKPRGVAHLLVALAGVDEPMMIAFRGMNARRMLGQGRERGVIPMYGAKIVGAATRMARKAGRKATYPMCAFHLSLGPSRNEAGEPTFTKVGQGSDTSQIVYPAWLDEPKAIIDEALVRRLYVGNEKFAKYQSWHQDAEAWSHSWSGDQLAENRGRGRRTAEPVGKAEGKGGTPAAEEVPF